MNRMVALIAVALLGITPAQVEVVKADYAYCASQGIEARYLWMPKADPDLIAAVSYQVVASSRQPLLDNTIPQRLGDEPIWRIDINALSWKQSDWQAVFGFQANGYTSKQNPLVVPAAHFLNEVADGRESDAYLRFVFSGKVPKTEDEFLKAFGIDRAKQAGLEFGWVEGDSAVNNTADGARLVAFADGVQTSAWITYDTKKVVAGSDPLQELFPGKFKHDASEFFVLSPKVSTDGTRGVFPFTGLADGTGRIVAEAPTDLVRDHTETFGDAVIVNPAGCVSCHNEGPKQQGLNALRDRLSSGLDLKTYEQKKQIQADLFHLGSVQESLDRWQQDYTVTLKAVCGLTPLELSTSYRAALKRYRSDVTLEVAAAELSTDAETLRLSIAWASKNYVDVQVRTAGMAHNKTMPRETFEQEYLKLQSYLEAFSNN